MRRRLSDIGLALILLALAFCPGKAYPQKVAMMTMPPDAYNKEAFVILPRMTAVGVIVPSGDTVWIGNVVDTITTPAGRWQPECDTLLPAVVVSRLRVAVNQKHIAEMLLHERGRTALTPGLTTPLRDGSTLYIREVTRRKTTCGLGDGLLVVWVVIGAPPIPK